ncbi:MAG: protein translocase subunit SecD [Lachnospiraceae bacterium]|jgi:SecD/SecF fusion protein|nr:protein translocase subunit SecD [Lachnospiraceae bacterium]MEE3460878.1 protein translocase subunit SecD [Lachnospiraceae bacterium]
MNKNKGLLTILITLIIIGLSGYGILVGFTDQHKLSAKNIILGLDLNGGVSITYEVQGKVPTQTEMKDTIKKMQDRAEVYSTESSVVQEGSKRIVIDIPGAKDAEKVLKGLGREGSLDFVGEDDVTEGKNGKVSYDKSAVICTGADVKTAEAGNSQDPTTHAKEYVVDITFTESGTKKFADATAKAVVDHKRIFIIYDGKTLSDPTVQAEIDDGVAQISGGFETYDEAKELASGIRIGALPVELKEVQSQSVDAQLGQGALSSSITAGIVGFILVVLIMLVFYRLPGLSSSIALIVFICLYLLAINALNVTLTLPGVAGVVLNIGMAVDANVIIFQRIKEELAKGKTVSSAIDLGFSKALSAIIDSNVTTLIAAIVLYAKGTGTVRGFAITLAIGIILSFVTAITVTRLLLKSFCALGVNDIKFFGVQKERKIIDFVGKRKIFFTIAIVLIACCGITLGVNKANTGKILNYGLEFVGGTTFNVPFNDDTKIDDSLKKDVEKIVEDKANTDEVILAKVSGKNTLKIQTSSLDEETRDNVVDALADKYKLDSKDIVYENITGSISSEVRRNAVIAVIIAAICMLIYIAVRFSDFVFAGTAVLAILHDIIMVLLLYAVSKIAVGSTFIAVMLTILGYSINSTIVIFDRVRENLKGAHKDKETFRMVVNKSVTDTLSRSINTNLTTFVMLFTLVIFGVSSVRDFAVPLMVGIIAGTYSSIFITSPLWYTFKAPALPDKAPEVPQKGSKKSKKKAAANTESKPAEDNNEVKDQAEVSKDAAAETVSAEEKSQETESTSKSAEAVSENAPAKKPVNTSKNGNNRPRKKKKKKGGR